MSKSNCPWISVILYAISWIPEHAFGVAEGNFRFAGVVKILHVDSAGIHESVVCGFVHMLGKKNCPELVFVISHVSDLVFHGANIFSFLFIYHL